MRNMRFKVGDRVRIKSLDWYNENKDADGIVELSTHVFIPEMVEHCGTVVTIKDVFEDIDDNAVYYMEEIVWDWTDEMLEGLVEEETKPEDMGEVSDGYHTFNELYEYRMLYNAALFNEFAKQGLYDVHKSRKHSDGEYPFGDSNWFIVMAELPTGQISNHYEMKDWFLFDVPEKEVANVWDGHTPKDVTERLRRFLTPKPVYPKTYEDCAKVILDRASVRNDKGYKAELLVTLQKILVCRDAYWKIAGDEMGLGKPWEPDYTEESWEQGSPIKYVIYYTGTNITKERKCTPSYVLSFPTAEMRDVFYENFKELINECKELL